MRRLAAGAVVVLASLSLSNCKLDELLSPAELGRLAFPGPAVVDSARLGSAATRTVTATIDVEGASGSLDFTARTQLNSTWLRLDRATGTAPGSLSATLDPAGLALGTYRDTVLLSTASADGDLLRVPVEFRILPCGIQPLPALPASLTAALSTADCASPRSPGQLSRLYRFTAAAADSISARVTSSAFAPYIAIVADGVPGAGAGTGASALDPDAVVIGEADACAVGGTGGTACLRYVRIAAAGSYVIEVRGTGNGAAGGFELSVGLPRPPNGPTAATQVSADGSALAVGIGGAVSVPRIQLGASVSDPDLDSLRLEVEVRPVGTPFSGAPTASSALGAGPAANVVQEGLLDDSAYRWQLRAVDVTGRASAWTAFGGNGADAADFVVAVPDAPAAPTGLAQLRTNGAAIPSGGITDESVVRLRAAVADPDPGDQLRLEVEVRAVGTEFIGTATAVSALTASGSVASVDAAGLADGEGYRWQARTVDLSGRASAWVRFGAGDAAPDFRIALTPSLLAFMTQPSPAAAGTVIAPAIRVAAQDAQGNTRTSFTGAVTIAIASGPAGGALSGSLTVNAVGGIATFADLRADRTGTYTLRAASGLLGVTSTPFAVSVGSALQLAFTAAPTAATAGAVLTPPVQLTVRDALENVSTGFTGDVTVALGANTPAGTLSGTLTVAVIAGVATFDDLRIDRAGTGFTLLATSIGVTSAESAPITVTAGAATALELVTPPSVTAVSGVALTTQPVVRLLDANDNPVGTAGTLVTAVIASGPEGATLAGATATTATAGSATFTGLAITGAAGAYELRFESAGLSAVTGPATTLGAGAATRLLVVTQPSAVAASGEPFVQQPVVRVADAGGNGVDTVGVAVTATIASGGGTLGGTATVLTGANGVATFTELSISGSAGARTLTFSAADLAGVTSGSITLGAGGATQVELVTGDGQSAVAGSAVATPPAVRVLDASGNPVAGVAVSFAVTAGGGVVSPVDAVLTNAAGIAALTSWTLGTTAGVNTVAAGSGTLTGSPVAFTATGTAGVATIVTSSGGNDLTGQVGTTLATPHEVRVTDANGNPVAGISVAWTASGGGSVSPTISVTGADGRATTTRTLGATPGAQGTTAVASLPGGPSQVSFALTATVGPSSQMAIAGGDAQVDTVGATLPVPISVVVRDALNNPVAGVTISWTVIGGGGSVAPTSTVTNAAGIASANWTLGTATSLTDSTQLARASGVGTPVNFIATARPGTVDAAETQVSVAPATIAASRTAPATVTVTARDGFGNLVPGQVVALSASGAGGGVVQPTAPTGPAGVTTGSFGSTVAGPYTIAAVVGGVAAVQEPVVTVTSAPSFRLAFVQPPTDAVAGAAIAPAVTVEVLDSLGNRNTASSASVTLALAADPGASTLGGTLTRAVVAGVATFPDLTLDRVSTGYTLNATSGSLLAAVSAPFAVSVGSISAARSTVGVAPTTVTAAVASTVTVTALDANDNPISGATVVLAASGEGNTVTQPVGVTNASGIATGTVSSTFAEVKTVSATIGGVSVSGTATLTVTSAAVSAARTLVSAAPGSIVAGGAASTITVTARDAFDNPVPGATVDLAATGTGNMLTQPAGPTDAAGVATGSLSSTGAGIKTVSVAVNEVAITATAAVTVVSGAVSATQASVAVGSSALVAGATPTTVTITARDASGNPVAGATVVIAATGTGNTVVQATGTTNAAGVAIGSFTSTVAEGKTISASINGVAIAQTVPVAVSPAAVSPATSTVSAAPTSIVAATGLSTVTITARDAFSNPVAGATVLLAATGTGNTLATPALTNALGVTTATLSSTVAAVKVISATINSVAITQTATVTVTSGAVSAAQSTLVSDVATLTAGPGTATITVTARDANANPIAGAAVVLAVSGTGSTITQPAVTDALGVATGTFASTRAEVKAVSATIAGVAITQTAVVTVGPAAVSGSQSTLEASSAVIAAGAGSATLTVTARDAFDNPVPGATVVLVATGTLNTLPQPAVTNALGVTTTTFASTVSEAKTISATVAGVPLAGSVLITVSPDAPSGAQSTIAVAPGTVAAGATVTVTVTARDASGNVIPGVTVAIGVSGEGNTITQPAGVTAANGVATATFISSLAGAKTVTATVNGISVTPSGAVTVTAAAVSAANSLIAAAPGTITAGGTGSTITVTARDAFDNPVPGVAVVLAASGTGNTVTQPAGVTNAQGVATGTVASTQAIAKTISATVGGVAITPTASLTVTPAAVSAATSTVVAAPTSIVAAGAASTIAVTARDQYSNLIEGATVVLAATGAGNTLTQPSAATSALGVTTGTLGSTASGAKVVSAVIAGTTITPTATVTVTAGAVSAAQSLVSATAAITAGGAGSTVTVTARDANQNPIAGATVTFAVSGTGNTLTQPTAVTNAAGVATGTFTSTVAEAKTVTATIGATVVTQTAAVVVNPAAPAAATSTVTAAPGTLTAGAASSTITVTARDAFSNVIPGATVVLAATGSGNTLSAPAVTNALGVTTATFSSTGAELKTISATIGGVSLTQTAAITVSPAAVSAATSTVSAAPGSVAAGVQSTITVTARDAFSNLIPGATVALAATGTGNTLSTPAATNALGVTTATFSSTLAEPKMVSATINAVAITQTAAVTVTPGAVSAAQSLVSATSPITAGGTGSTVTVTARDANSNPIAGATVTFAVSGTGNTLTQPAVVTNALGVATGSFASTAAQTKTVTATIGATPVTQTATVTVVPDEVSATTSTVTASPLSVAAGVASTVTVTARDQFGNVIPGAAVVVAATGTGNTVSSPAVTNALGVTTATVSSTAAGPKTISATIAGGAITQTATLTVTAGPATAAQSSVAAASPITAGGAGSTVTVTARDANGNPVSGATVTFTVSGASNALTQPAGVTNAAGVITGSFTSTVAEAKTVTASVGATVVTQTATVIVTAGAVSAAQSLVSATSPITAGGAGSTVTVTARDANQNPIAGAAVTFTVSGTGNTPVQPAVVTNAAGVATGSFTSGVAEPKTVTATIGGVVATQTATVVVNPGAVSSTVSTVTASGPITAGGAGSTVTVTARDALGNPISGQAVTFTVSGTDNSLTQPAAVTNTVGIATGSFTTTQAVLKTVTATIGATAVSPAATVTVNPAVVSAATSTVTAAPGSVAAGVASTITVTARDQYSNPIPGATVALASTGTLNTLVQPAVTNALGVTTGTISSTLAEPKVISATINAVAITQTAGVTVTPGAVSAAQSLVGASPETLIAGAGFSTVTVTARDANSNPIAGATVVLAVSGSGNLVTQPVGVTNALGVTTGSFSSTGVGLKEISATIAGVAITMLDTVRVGPAAVAAGTSTVSVTPGSIVAGSGSATVTVTARDAFSNAVPGATVVVAVSGTGNAVSAPAVTDAAGVTTATVSSTVAQAKTISATVNSVPITQTASLTVTAGPPTAAQSTVTATSPITAGGAGSTVTVTARDVNGNPVSGATVSFIVSGTGNALTQPVGVTSASGEITGSFTSTVAELKTVTASIGATVVTQTAAVTVNPGTVSAATSTVTAAPGSVAAGVPSTMTITARDASSNVIPGATVVLAATGTGNTLATPAVTNALGVTTATFSSTVAEAKTISATINAVPITQTAAVTVTAGAVSAAQSLVSATSPITAGGTGSTVTVTARDANQNPIAGQTVTFAVSGTGNTLTQPAAVTNAAGVATGSFTSTIAEPKTVTATISATVVTQTAAVVVEAGVVSPTVSTVAASGPLTAGGAGSTVTVTARDASGNPISGQSVTFTVSGAGNTLTQPAAMTNAAGVATGSFTTTEAVLKTVTATIGATAVSPAATVTVNPAVVSAATSTVTAAPGSVGPGVASTITVTARDQYSNVIPGATVALASTGTANTLSTPAVTDALGVTTATLSSTVAEPKVISATINTVPITQTAAVTVTAGAVSAAQSLVSAATPITAGGTGSTVSVTARDADQNPIAGATVTFAVSGTGNTLTQPVAVTNALGVASGSFTSTVAESKTVTATIGGTVATQTATVIVNPAAVSAANSLIAATPGTITAGGTGSTITVTARDAFDNPVPGATVVLTASGTGNTLTQPVGVTNALGVATGTVASTQAIVKTISATVGGVAITPTASVTVTPAVVSAATSTVVAAPASIVAAGAASTITVTARDQYSNLIEGATVVLAATGAGNTLTQPAAATSALGVTTGTLASTASGEKVVSATINAVAITETATVTVTAGAVSGAQSLVSATSPMTAGGAGSTVTVTARDANQNPIAGATVTFTVSGTGNTLTQPAAVTNAAGMATGSFTTTEAALKTVTATIGATVVTQTAAVTVNPAAVSAVTSTVTAAPGSVAAGVQSTITVTARDQYSNVIPGATVALSATGTGNTLSTPAVTNALGVTSATFSSTVAESKVISATINTVAITQTAAVTVTAGAVSAAQSLVSATSPITAGGTGSTVSVTARDADQNPIAGATVTFAVSGTGNTLTQPAAVSNALGVATGSFTTTEAALKTVTATIGATVVTQTAAVTVDPAAAATLEFVQQPTAAIAGSTIAPAITVRARDAFANIATGFTGTVTLAIEPASGTTGAAIITPSAAAAAAVAGVATFGGVAIDSAGTGYQLRATATGATGVLSTAFAITPGAASAATSTISTSAATVAEGGTATITLTARDALGNRLTTGGLTIVLDLAADGSSVGTLSAVTDVGNGTYTAVFTATTAGTPRTVQATLNGAAVTSTAPTIEVTAP